MHCPVCGSIMDWSMGAWVCPYAGDEKHKFGKNIKKVPIIPVKIDDEI